MHDFTLHWRLHRAPLLSVLALVACVCALAAWGNPLGPVRSAARYVYLSVCSTGTADQTGYAAENDAAMNKMMAAMNVPPSGDIDRDFAAMMTPHHQGAIDMAQAMLRYGHNEQLRRIAQEIIVEQQQEIAAMRLALDQDLPPSAPAPTQAARN